MTYQEPSIQGLQYWARLAVPLKMEGSGVGCRSELTLGASRSLDCELFRLKDRSGRPSLSLSRAVFISSRSVPWLWQLRMRCFHASNINPSGLRISGSGLNNDNLMGLGTKGKVSS